ncbi:MAG: short-chain dehydrogenase, partial [Glaciihabitans sp.]|nr:short-chain dehydrogenase [Glaciihabitans sp.]
NNAGGIMGKREVTGDGHEKTFQVNHLAPFLLTNLLMDRLVASGASVINTSSAANKVLARFDIDDLENANRYSASRAYGNGKLANILFTKELVRRYGEAGISSAAFHPGVVATSFGTGSSSAMKLMYGGFLSRFLLTPAQGADTLVWLGMTHPGTDWTSGEYYEKRRVIRANKQAYDDSLATELWDRSSAMVL